MEIVTRTLDTLIEYVTKREDNRKEAEKMKRDLEAMGHERKAECDQICVYNSNKITT